MGFESGFAMVTSVEALEFIPDKAVGPGFFEEPGNGLGEGLRRIGMVHAQLRPEEIHRRAVFPACPQLGCRAER